MPATGFILDDIENLRESAAVEFKLAAGRHGKGALPLALWESYSAFANTNGGEIILGVREEKGEFFIEGIAEPRPLSMKPGRYSTIHKRSAPIFLARPTFS